MSIQRRLLIVCLLCFLGFTCASKGLGEVEAPSATGQISPLPLRVRRAAHAPIVDGRLNEPEWQAAEPLSTGPCIVKGISYNTTLYVGVEVQGSSRYIDLVVSNEDRSVTYRILLAPGGASYGSKHRLNPEGKWERDLTWSFDAVAEANSTGKVWNAEVSIPRTKGFICVQGWDPHDPSRVSQWYPLHFVSDTPPITQSLQGSTTLENMTEDELIALADQQAMDPDTLDHALAALSVNELVMGILTDASIPDEEVGQRLHDALKGVDIGADTLTVNNKGRRTKNWRILWTTSSKRVPC